LLEYKPSLGIAAVAKPVRCGVDRVDVIAAHPLYVC
jgi:hypothetical protein